MNLTPLCICVCKMIINYTRCKLYFGEIFMFINVAKFLGLSVKGGR